MGWTEIIIAVIASGIITSLATGWINRRLTKAQANNSNADYAEKIIKQADDRVAQYKDDMERMRDDRDKCQEECRGQRKAKREWRGKYEESVSRIHELELSIKDKDAKLAEAEWHRCETNGCPTRIPPRKREIQIIQNDDKNTTSGSSK